MDLELSDKIALVTGSSKGIGLAIVTSLAREGARVILNGRTDKSVAEGLAAVRQEVPNAKVEGFVGDLGSSAGADAVTKKFPAVDILVNNLGIFEPKPFEEIPDDDWRRFFEVNVLSGVRLSRFYLPKMKQKNWGRIVFISSESGIHTPGRDDSLWHDQNSSTCRLARPCRNVCGDGRHGERGTAGPNAIGGHR